MSENAYTFRYHQLLPIGTYVEINGKYDTYGKVYAHLTDPTGNPVHRVRGIGHFLPQGKGAVSASNVCGVQDPVE